jgi:catalase
VHEPLCKAIIDAINEVAGVHPGHRAVHAKGTLCAATFTAAPAAAHLTTAAHMQGDPIRAHVRFSNGSGDPDAPDGAPDGRGMAVKLYLPEGTTTDIVAVTLPCFFVRTAADFLDFTRARKPDPETGQPDMAVLGAFLGAHPEAQPALQAALSANPPTSYMRVAYNGIHAFRFIAASGTSRYARCSLEPPDGEEFLDRDEARRRDPNYLQLELGERLAAGPGIFSLVAQLADPSDPIDDPTVAWPPERERVELGRLEVTGLAFDREQDDDVLVFDPTRVTPGIECSDDQILQARSHAYAESVLRRSGVARA